MTMQRLTQIKWDEIKEELFYEYEDEGEVLTGDDLTEL